MKELTLETRRLRLLPFIPEDTERFQLLNNDAFIRKFLWDDEKIDAITADEIMEQNLRYFEEDQFGLWEIKLSSNDETIGYAGLWHFFDGPQPQLIYALLEPHTHKGLATEAGRAIIAYAFETLGYNYLVAATDEPNIASQRVAMRLGMSFVSRRLENGRPTLFYQIDKTGKP
nr:GNAT family N-acetyltransferase [Allomuricauda sp.]